MRDTAYTDFRDAFFEELFRIAKKDPDVILLMADQEALSFEKFKKEIPKQIINAGIAEQNMIGVAAGLALSGKKVFVHAIANFTTLRCYEQIKVDLSIMNLPVTIVGVGAGFAYTSDGPTHHANQDIAAMRAIPGMTIFNASDTNSLSKFSHLAYKNKGPVYIRFDKGSFPVIYNNQNHNFEDGLSIIKEGSDILIISTGTMVHHAMEISNKVDGNKNRVTVLDLYRIKPLNEKLLKKIIRKYKKIITLEEHIGTGGIGTIISDLLADNNVFASFKRFALRDANCFVYGERNYMQRKMKLGTGNLSGKILNFLNEKK